MVGKEESLSRRRGEPSSHPVIRSTGALGAFLALVGGRAAQRR